MKQHSILATTTNDNDSLIDGMRLQDKTRSCKDTIVSLAAGRHLKIVSSIDH